MKITFLPLIAVMLAVLCSCQSTGLMSTIPRDTHEVVEQKDAEAQSNLDVAYDTGECFKYDTGECIAENRREEVRLLRMAAEQGHAGGAI